MRATRLTSRLLDLCCCFLSYVLIISLCAPLAARRALAATPNAGGEALSATPSKAITQSSQHRAGELIIRFREGASEQEKNAFFNQHGVRRKKLLRGASRIEKLELQPGQEPEALAEELRSLPSVELVEPNFLITRDEIIPDDPRFSEQWALKNSGQSGGLFGSDVSAAVAWETTTGARTTIIAVIDSGIDFTHPDLRNNQWANTRERDNGRDDDRDGFTDDLHGWDWVANDNQIRDEQGHGTAIAGIVAAEGNNGTGITGVMWKAGLMSLRVLDNTGTGDVADAVEAIDYALEHGAQVINCSWGTDQESVALRDAIERAGRAGVVVVSSAGNSGRNIETAPYYPASYGLSNQIIVAATDKFDVLTSWSNYGNGHVTIAAPGTDILTTRIGGGYTTVTGTSASTPLATGVVGLIKTERWWLSAAGTRAAIIDGARRVDGLTGKVSSGGIINASGALSSLRGPNTPPPGNGNGNNGNNGGGNGNGGNPPDQPPTPRYGSGGTGQGGSFSTTPPVTQGVPGSLPPNLDEVRKRQPTTPRAPAPINADICYECDPGGGDPPPPSGGDPDPYFATARSRPQNEIGQPNVDLGSRNFNWSVPLVSLPGRAGFDLNFSISYNSLVWTKQGNAIMFNADQGSPTPGFRLGLPSLQPRYTNQDDLASAYMLIMPSGHRIELRQVGTSNVYEAQDSSYVQAIYSGIGNPTIIVRTTDGTQYTFTYPQWSGVLRCTQIKDRNGNYITMSYDTTGQLTAITDTLGRILNFNYVNNYLSSITQTWNGQTHVWATFGYGTLAMNTNFPGMSYQGPLGSIIVLTQVGLHDGTRYNFDYTTWGQVYRISHYAADNHLLKYTSYNLPLNNWTPHYDCPRFTERRDWAENWNNNQEAITYYSVDPNSAGGEQPAWSQMTTPDGTVHKELYATTGWQKGLPIGTEVWVGGIKKKWTTTLWTQDDTSLTYQKNPRLYDVNTYDEAGNRRHIDISYHASFGLPYEVREYSADGSGYAGFMRRTYTDYRFDSAYIDRRIIGLVSAVHVVDENNNYVTKLTFDYDRGGEYLVGTASPATQHDTTNYGAGFVYGRGLQTDVWRWDVTDVNNPYKAIRQQHKGYNTTGAVVFTRDALNHQTTVSYTDNFSDGVNRNTFAYPTTVTDADNYSSTQQYNYDFGAVTRTQDPKGAAATTEYDGVGRALKVTNQVNGAYTRWVYNPYGDIATFTIVQSGSPEAFSVTYFDGAGRLRAAGGDNPNSSGGYMGQFTLYDIMGRPSQTSNPAEMTGGWVPTGDDAAGWVWTYQSYDWQGRPTITTFPSTDGGQTSQTIEMSYGGCGCAGGDVITSRDERGRRRRMTMDIVGRLKRVEELNWDTSVYSTTNYTYNGRGQMTSINQMGQVRSFEYDGYGRLWRRTTPEQGVTTYTYNPDDTIQTHTDARGAVSSYSYNNRHLLIGTTYSAPAGVTATPNVSFGYDEAGNRTSMTDGLGSVTYHYDQLSRMDWEERAFTGLGTYRLSYGYNLEGELTSVTGPSQFGSVNVGYTYDKTGRATAVTGSGYAGVSSYIGSLSYRAFGGVKQASYGNSRALSINYDNRLRMTRWDVAGVLGSDYEYRWEGTFKPTFARSRTDATLDRYYGYDHVGRLHVGRSGSEARAANGEGWNGLYDGPYSTGLYYDVWGNLTIKEGWGGVNPSYTANYTNNRRNGFVYDAAGNLTNDGQQTYSYDATGQQTYASGTGLQQSYDGDGLRVRKTEGGATTYYLRSSALGQQVVAEINSYGGWQRGYVYLGSKLLALQDNGVLWVHQDPVTKSQRLTDNSGNVISWVELDPWGGETGRSINSQRQPRRYTSYERDSNGGDEAMMRRYEGRWQRFAQPDPFDGSYNLTDPQSFNRYSYVQNDPVTFSDPSGLQPCWGAECGWGSVSAGFWGWGDLMNRPRNTGREIIREAEERSYPFIIAYWDPWERGTALPFVSMFAGYPQDLYDLCKGRAATTIPRDAAQAILNTSAVEGIDPTLLSVTWRHESGFSFNPPPNPRYEGKGRNRKLVGYDTGPMQISTNYYDKSPFTDGLSDAFGTFAMNMHTKEYAPFNGNPYDNLRAAARAYTKDILSRSKNNADAAGLYRAGSRTGPGYGSRSAEYSREAARDRDFFNCLMGK